MGAKFNVQPTCKRRVLKSLPEPAPTQHPLTPTGYSYRFEPCPMRMPLLHRVPVRSFLIFWLFVLSAVGFLDRTNISIAGPAIRSELGLDDIRLGWVFSSFLLGYAAFQVVGGWLAYRFGPRLVLGAGVLWWGVFSALTTLAHPYQSHALLLFITIRFALGAGEAVISSCLESVCGAVDSYG